MKTDIRSISHTPYAYHPTVTIPGLPANTWLDTQGIVRTKAYIED